MNAWQCYFAQLLESYFSVHVVYMKMRLFRNLVKRSVVNIYAGNVVLNGFVASIWSLYTSSIFMASKQWTIEYKEFDRKSDTWVTAVQAINLNMILGKHLYVRLIRDNNLVLNLHTHACTAQLHTQHHPGELM